MKKVLCVIIALVLILSLAACGGFKKGTPEATVDTLMSAIKVLDVEKIQSVMANSVDPSEIGLDSVPEALMKQVKAWLSKMTYKIGTSTVNGESAEVPVDIKYIDASPVIKAALTEYMTQAVSMALSGKEVTEEAMAQLLSDIIEDKVKTEKTETAEASINIKLTKTGDDWKVSDISEEIVNVILSNMLKSIEEVFGGLLGN